MNAEDTFDDFPPFDFSQRPSCDERGVQLAPETFLRWLAPACWEDTEGAAHFDIALMHAWLGLPPGTFSIEETGDMLGGLLRQLHDADGQSETTIIVRKVHGSYR